MKMNSVMKHQFSQVPTVDVPRSSFDRSHGYKTAFDAGKLIPFFCDEVLPGDTFNVDATVFARLATPIAPVMDNINLDIHYFFVPCRLVWDNFQKFMGEQDNPGDSTDYTIPVITNGAGGLSESSIFDYFGLPTGINFGDFNALPFRAYNLIYNEWYRDENLQDSLDVYKTDGPDARSDYALKNRGKRHDYFTSCLPWPQKGDTIDLPLGTTAPVVGTTAGMVIDGSLTTPAAPAGMANMINNGSGFLTEVTGSSSLGVNITSDATETTVFADLSNATASTINSLREAFQLQRMLERDARGGTRYTEIIKSHFGVTSPDARLQRPEFLGGKTVPVNISQVPQTSSTDATTPQGNLAAFGTALGTDAGFTKSFTEHGYVIGIVSARADLTYQQGINRMWSRSTRYDLYWPSLSHLGEQEVLNKEIYAQASTVDTDADGTPDNDEVFGYQERYAEYRYKPSMITGTLRSTATTPLDMWHLSQEFSSLPVLNDSFIQENPPIDRVVAVPSEPDFIMDSYIKCHCARPMPVRSVPGLIDHF